MEKTTMKGGNMRMKATYLVIALLVIEIFAISYATALPNLNVDSDAEISADLSDVANVNVNNDNKVSVDVPGNAYGRSDNDIEVSSNSRLAEAEINENESDEVIAQASMSSKLRRVGFSIFGRGFGSVNNDTDGHLATVVWASQRFALFDKNSNQTVNQTEVRTFGKLRIATVGTYDLYRYEGNEENSSTMKFYVIQEGKGKVTAENAEASSVGVMTLNKEESYKGLTQWEGTIDMDSSSDWQIDMSTDSTAVKPLQGKVKNSAGVESDATVDADLPGVRVGFWKRIFGRFR